MSRPALSTSLQAGALIRAVQAQGGFAAVLARGDPDAGALLIVAREKGPISGLYERVLDPARGYCWAATGPQDFENTEEIESYLRRRRERDPDLWLIELDIADAPRFIAELDARG